MTKRCFLGLLTLMLLTSSQFAQMRLIENSARRIVVEFELPAPVIETVQIDGETFTRIDYEGARMLLNAGEPMLPYSLAGLAIPPDAVVKIDYEILSREEKSGLTVLPGIPSGLESAPLQRSAEVYNSFAPYPAEVVTVSEPQVMRFVNSIKLSVYPVQFFPAEQRVQIVKKLRVHLRIEGGSLASRPTRLSATERDYHEQTLLNHTAAENWALPVATDLRKVTADYDFSSGEWFKIPVETEGIYRITGAQLRERGVNTAAVDVSTIQMFSHGGDMLPYNTSVARPTDLNEVAIQVNDANSNGTLDDNEAILFFGSAAHGWRSDGTEWRYRINPYSRANYYLLTFNRSTGKRIAVEQSPQVAGAQTPAEFTDLHYFYEDNYNILDSGLDWYWERFQGTSEQRSFNFTLPASVNPANATFAYRLKGGSGSKWFDNRSYRYTVDMLLNNAVIGQNLSFSTSSDLQRTANSNNLTGGNNTLTINYSANLEGSFMFLDFFEVRISRAFQAENNYLKFYYTLPNAPVAFTVSGFAGGTHRVWDVSDFANVRQIVPLSNGATVQFQEPASATPTLKSYYTFADDIIRNVETLERLDNRPNLRDPNRTGKLLLITSKALFDATEGWENLKETDPIAPMETERILVDDIYREFGGGIADPAAIRDFLKYAYENWGRNSPDPEQFRPHYVQFVGDASYDYRNIQLPNYINHVPVFEVTDNRDIDGRCTDLFFTAFSVSNTNTMDPVLPIGRFPANTVQEVLNYIEKIRNYRTSFRNPTENYAGWQSTITLVADDECGSGGNCSEWYHTDQSERIFQQIPRKFDVTKIYLIDFDTQAGGLGRQKPKATTSLLDQINRGTLIVNFFGHGDPNTWAHEQVLARARDLPKIQNGERVPLWIAATCTWGKYDNPSVPSMAEEMVWSTTGGGIASIAASRPTFSFDNLFFVRDFTAALFYDNDFRKRSRFVGDAMTIALNGDKNDQKYHLFGDVTLQLADPENLVEVSTISSDTLKALSKVTLNAEITDSTGQLLSNFNGKAVIRVYDAVDSVFNTTINRRYVYQGGTIFKGVVSVTNGRIENAGFIVPKSIKYKQARTGKLSIYAWSDDGDAAGFQDQLLFFGTESQVVDAEGPQIGFQFAEQPDFFDGDYIRQGSELVVALSDENGINLTGEVGHRIELVIDGTIRKDVTDFFVYEVNSFTKGQLRYILPNLSNGTHSLTISAWDNLNNYSEAQLTFTTASATTLMLDRVINYPNPFADETMFTFQFQSPNGVGDVTIKIYTVNGRLIREVRDIARPGFNKIPWDSRDADGDLVANGVYLYKVVIDDGEKTVEKIEKLAITR